jgi:hypothetical protein
MLSRSDALEVAQKSAQDGVFVREEDAQELSNGWYFPWHLPNGETLVGSHGVIVNKESGRCFSLGSAFTVDRDLRAYEAGYESLNYDIKLTKVHDRRLTLDFLEELGITVVEPELAHGTVWRIPRRLSREELGKLLEDLPRTFPNVMVYFRIEAIERVRADGCCEFDLIEPEDSAAA